ncbi:MAG TPA: hypothetical protein VH157_06975 [Bryobacteraceae bacterium]|jgi:hypothetical protein|nr:hypothetical protein [Bryobacteraceae bacterium]
MASTLSGYSNPIRSFERRLNPSYAEREFRNPGLTGTSGLGGVGSLRRTMPHLERALRLQGGGSLDPVGQLYAASRPNLYNPDPMHRRVLALEQQMAGQFRNPAFTAFPGSTMTLPYQQGGPAPEDSEGPSPEDLEEPEGDLSQEGQEDKQVMVEAMMALDGEHPHPEEALERFVQIFGESALGDLERIIQGREGSEGEGEEGDQQDEGDEGDQQNEELGSAGGGLLEGPGTGQSDEIEGRTPSGRPVLLSDGEYVVDAPTVAALGDGSTNAGARRLDELRRRIRQDSYGSPKQAKPMRRGGQALLGR